MLQLALPCRGLADRGIKRLSLGSDQGVLVDQIARLAAIGGIPGLNRNARPGGEAWDLGRETMFLVQPPGLLLDRALRATQDLRHLCNGVVEGWGGESAPGRESVLSGVVRVVEPGGFTKVSALGVEEQRVNVIVDPVRNSNGAEDEAASPWDALGDGYRVELRIVLHEADDVLLVSTGALFREAGAWCVWVLEDGRATHRTVELGRRNGLVAEITSGLAEGESVILYPSEQVGEGERVEPRDGD